MYAMTVNEVSQVRGGLLKPSGIEGSMSAILFGAAWAVGELGLDAMIVPGIGTAVGGFLEAGAAVTGAVGGVLYLTGH